MGVDRHDGLVLTRLLAVAGGTGGFTTTPPSGVDYGVGIGDSGLTGTSLTKLGTILTKGGGGAWDAALVESPAVWLDPPGGVNPGMYGMVYVGYAAGPADASIGLAWASDPAGPWTKDPANPILVKSGSGNDSHGVTGPFVWISGSTYHLFYIGLTGLGYEGGTASLMHATSTDLVTWTRLGQIVAPTSGWRSANVFHCSIVQTPDLTYHMFLNAKGSHETIGYASSTDLASWTVDDADSPILDVGSGWESSWIGDPSVYLVGSTYWMAYYGFNGTHAYDGLASASSFPLSWSKYGSNPVLSPGGSGSNDEKYAHKPYIFQTASGMWHYYTAVDASDLREIAVAEATA
jgi:predicted GH43/DUF377 family glycosyl hydrolase